MENNLNKVEAVLFTTGRFMEEEELSNITGIASIGILKESLKKLQEEYDKNESSLQLIENKNKWKLGLRKQYIYLTSKLLDDSELDRPTQETLAIIAYKQPLIQSDVIKLRGNKAYDHIKLLKENGMVVSEPFGRTRLLKLAPKFFDYFDVADLEKLKEVGDKKLEEIQNFKEELKEIHTETAKEDSPEASSELEEEIKEEIIEEQVEEILEDKATPPDSENKDFFKEDEYF